MTVVYGMATVTGGAPPVTVVCSPASGSVFQIGSTAAECTATDQRQRLDTCTFTVTLTAPPRISLTRFLAFGDSMTAGEVVDLNSVRGLAVHDELSYPTDLRLQLASRYTAQTVTVRNEGRSGEAVVASNAPRRLSALLASGQYDVVLIMEGANDIASRDSRDIPRALDGLRFMVRDARSRGLRPFLGTLPPESGLARTLVSPFNAQLKAMAMSEAVPVADVFDAFNGDFSFLGSDGLHPNAAGYQKIADTFFAVIKQNLELPPTSNPTRRFTLAPPARRR
jgi:lysophospholipase L1-like esterase